MFKGICAAVLCAAGTAFAQTPAPSVETFFSKPDIAQAAISPTGKQVALTAKGKDGHLQLVVIDTEKLSPTVVASFTTGDVVNIHWVSDKRLVYSASDPDRETSAIYVPLGLYAVNSDGSDYRNLLSLGNGMQIGYNPAYNTQFLSTTWLQDSDDIFVTQPKLTNTFELDYMRLMRMDTHTGVSRTAWLSPGESLAWFVGPDDKPEYVVERDGKTRASIMYMDSAANQWKKVGSFDRFGGEAFQPVGFASDGTTYVLRRAGGSDYTALYTFDPKTQKFSDKPIVSANGFDLNPHMLRSGSKVIGMRYVVDAEATHWFDPEMKKVQAKIDALLPATVNRIEVPLRAQTSVVLVVAYSDVEPGQFFLYDTKTEKVTLLGHRKKAIDPKQMGRRDLVRVKTRDNFEMPVWVTTPRGEKTARPAVVLVHGGPWVRGGWWQWDRDAEFLASRGYVVIEPEFRGSLGFGFKWFRASWKQWGLAMQNDVADATRWAIEKGMADPKRICIAGASYGGYATLMGLANDSDLYKCGFEWIGVTDINLLYSISWSDTSDEYKIYGMPVMVADRQKDAAQIKATSPIELASKIRQPLLMGYGAGDPRVPIQHGKDFLSAVEKTNHDVEWVVYPDEGHGWAQLKDNVDWWTRVEKFLARNIGDK
jgi:dipeptidyl aminopeptidase/acylaminoacyl peptidase